jgi:hypothetical protein
MFAFTAKKVVLFLSGFLKTSLDGRGYVDAKKKSGRGGI